MKIVKQNLSKRQEINSTHFNITKVLITDIFQSKIAKYKIID